MKKMIQREIKRIEVRGLFALSNLFFLDLRISLSLCRPPKKGKTSQPKLLSPSFSLLTFRVLPDRHQVDVVVPSLVPGDGETRPHVGVQLQLLAQRQVERAVSFTDGGGHRPFKADPVLEDRVEVLARDHGVGAGVDGRADVLLVPGDGHARGVEDGTDGVGDLRADALIFFFFE